MALVDEEKRNCRFSESRAEFPCFFSGDPRINEHPGVALMHIIFLRYIYLYYII